MSQPKIAMLTAGGLAPCLSASVGALIESYARLAPDAEIIGYLSGYQGLLQGRSVRFPPEHRNEAGALLGHGGSILGNSRVKITNAADCAKRGLVQPGEDPLQVAAERLKKDGVTILHTIGGDDTNTSAADLAAFMARSGDALTVVGLPKTVDNDVFPIRQSLGAATAAEQGAIFFENVVNECTANPRMFLIHEVMGRNCGWLTAATARAYRERLARRTLAPELGLTRDRLEIDAVYIPERAIDIPAEAARLKAVMDAKGCASVFVSEGACVDEIVREMTARGESVERDAFGHVKLDKINVGDWFAGQFARLIGAEKTLVQKSGYFARSAAPNAEDAAMIRDMAALAARSGLEGRSGVIGHDEDKGGALRAIEFDRIKGGKPFDADAPWFAAMLAEIGQPAGETAIVPH